MIERVDDLVKKLDVEFLVKVQDAVHGQRELPSAQAFSRWVEVAQARACGGVEGQTGPRNDAAEDELAVRAARQAGLEAKGGYDPGTAGKAGRGGLWLKETKGRKAG